MKQKVGLLVVMALLMMGIAGCTPYIPIEPDPTPTPTPKYELTIASTEGGSVIAPGEGTFTYDKGTIVGLLAEAEDCCKFVGWTGDVADSSSVATTVTMDGNKSVTANFELLNYDLTVNSADGGSVTEPGEGTFAYDCGTMVGLKAEPEGSYSFLTWTGDINNVADPDSATTTITVRGTQNITAEFILFAGGKGTLEDPYQVADWYHLDNVRNYLDNYFILINSLNSTSIGYTANDGKGWQPIGNELAPFTGTFDGQGYEVKDLVIDRPDEDYIGLFGKAEMTIENLGVSGNITGKNSVGGLVGSNDGTITNAYSTVNVNGRNNVGGLVGINQGTVTNAYSTGSINSNWNNIGGLVGSNQGNVSNAYSTGSVTGLKNVGGLIGSNDNEEGVTSSFWDIETSGKNVSAGGIGKTTMEMQNIITFTEWDIVCVVDETNNAYVWNIIDGETYPFLSWQQLEG